MPTHELELAPADSPDMTTLARVDSPAIWKTFAEQLAEMESKAGAIVVKDATQVSVMKTAATMRKAVKALRCDVENKRKELVAGLNKATEAINSEARGIRTRCEVIEARLEEQEQFAIRAESEQRRVLVESRVSVLHELGANPAHFNLGDMKEEEFQELIAGAKAAREAKLAAAAKVEADRIAQEKADAEERERQRVENERLKAEAAEREEVLAQEREAALAHIHAAKAAMAAEKAKAKAEREALEAAAQKERQRIEAEHRAEQERAAKERQAAEAKARHEREAAEAEAKAERDRLTKIAEDERRKAAAAAAREVEARILAKAEAARLQAAADEAAKAPDRDKLIAFAHVVGHLDFPEMTTDAGKRVGAEILQKAQAFVAWIEQKAKGL